MSPEDARHQKPKQLGLPLDMRSEAPRGQRSGEASTLTNGEVRSGNDQLVEQVVARGNVRAALARVRENRGSPGGRWHDGGGTAAVSCRVAPKALRALKQRVRLITRRSGGRSLNAVVAELRKYLPGCKEYFRLADTPWIFVDHDKWIRHRLRALQLKQWKRGPKVYAELRKLDVAPTVATRVAARTRRWWCNSAMLVHVGLDTRYYDRMGVPKLAR